LRRDDYLLFFQYGLGSLQKIVCELLLPRQLINIPDVVEHRSTLNGILSLVLILDLQTFGQVLQRLVIVLPLYEQQANLIQRHRALHRRLPQHLFLNLQALNEIRKSLFVAALLEKRYPNAVHGRRSVDGPLPFDCLFNV